MGDESEKQRWLPIESNPEVMNKFLHNCGLPKEQWAVADVFGLDEPLLAMLPQPVLSLMLLFPINDRYIEHCTKQEEALKTSQQVRLNLIFKIEAEYILFLQVFTLFIFKSTYFHLRKYQKIFST